MLDMSLTVANGGLHQTATLLGFALLSRRVWCTLHQHFNYSPAAVFDICVIQHILHIRKNIQILNMWGCLGHRYAWPNSCSSGLDVPAAGMQIRKVGQMIIRVAKKP